MLSLNHAFTQSALRELRAHTSTWPEARSAAKPPELQGREGNDQTRASPSEIMERRTCWPFHLAGDSGACLFKHRAWLSWRFLALLELPATHSLPTRLGLQRSGHAGCNCVSCLRLVCEISLRNRSYPIVGVRFMLVFICYP